MGIAKWESHGNGSWFKNWEWERMGIDHMGMGGNRNVKSHSRSSLVYICLTNIVYELTKRHAGDTRSHGGAEATWEVVYASKLNRLIYTLPSDVFEVGAQCSTTALRYCNVYYNDNRDYPISSNYCQHQYHYYKM